MLTCDRVAMTVERGENEQLGIFFKSQETLKKKKKAICYEMSKSPKLIDPHAHSLEVSHGFMKSFTESLSRAPPPSQPH